MDVGFHCSGPFVDIDMRGIWAIIVVAYGFRCSWHGSCDCDFFRGTCSECARNEIADMFCFHSKILI